MNHLSPRPYQFGILRPCSQGQNLLDSVDVGETSFLEPSLQLWSGFVDCTRLFPHRNETIQPPLQGAIICQGAILGIVIKVEISELDPPSGFDMPEESDKSMLRQGSRGNLLTRNIGALVLASLLSHWLGISRGCNRMGD